MSGFTLVVHFDGAPIDPAMTARITNRIAYRGADHRAAWLSDDGLAWGAVAVQAVTYEDAHDRQPYTRDGVTVFSDSRLDARPDLVRALHAAGQHEAALTLPDSALVLHAYLAFGARCTDHLIGDFAFALYDARTRTVFAARDHMGIRALFVARKGATLVISTELTAVRYHPAVSDTLDDVAVGDFLLFGKIAWLDKERTIFQDVRRVPGAHTLTASPGSHAVQRYWSLPMYDQPLALKTEDEYVEAYRDVLMTAVQDRMRAPRVRVGLSGGIDSAVLATMVVDLLAQGRVSSRTSFITTVYDRIHPDTEVYYARLTAQRLGVQLFIVPLDDYRPRGRPNLVAEPSVALANNAAGVPSPMLDLGDIGLNGQGGDELLVAAHTVRQQRQSQRRRSERHWSAHRDEPMHNQFPWLNPDFVRQAHLSQRWQAYFADVDLTIPTVRPAAHYYLASADWCFVGEDLAGIYNYHRVTLVFLDLRSLTLLLQWPDVLFAKHKWLSRLLLAGRVPNAVLNRPKVPLGDVLSSFRNLGVPFVPDLAPHPTLSRYTTCPALQDKMVSSESLSTQLRPHLLNWWLANH